MLTRTINKIKQAATTIENEMVSLFDYGQNEAIFLINFQQVAFLQSIWT